MDWFMPEWLLALALTFFVLDIFLWMYTCEALSWFAVVLLSIWLTWRIDAPVLWSILIFVGALIFFALLYYLVFRKTVGVTVRKWLQKGAPEESLHAIVGKVGVVRVIDGRNFIYLDGELWPVVSDGNLIAADTKMKITALTDGEVSLTHP